MSKHDVRAFSEGWGLFETDRGVEILRLDDPPNSRPLNCTCSDSHRHAQSCCKACRSAGYTQIAPDDPVFPGDEEAVAFVKTEAAKGSAFHQDAISRAHINEDAE